MSGWEPRNREAIVTVILEGRGETIDAPFIPSGWVKPAGLNHYEFNLETSKKILADAGYVDSDGDGILENPAGEVLKFTYKIPSNSSTIEQAALAIQQNYKEIGIDIEIIIDEYTNLGSQCIRNHDFDIYAMNCLFGLDPDLTTWWHSRSASDEPDTASFNFGSYKRDDVDELIELATSTLNQNERAAYYRDAAKIINDDAPMIFLFVQDNEMIYNRAVTGYTPSAFNVFSNIHNWAIEQ